MSNSSAEQRYETTFITRTELPDNRLVAFKERFSEIVTQFKGQILHTEDWGKRKLAYPIQRESRGQYTYVAYTGIPGVVAELERNLRIHEHVLRFLTVKLDPKIDFQKVLQKRVQPIEERERGDRGFDRDRDYTSRDYSPRDRDRDRKGE